MEELLDEPTRHVDGVLPPSEPSNGPLESGLVVEVPAEPEVATEGELDRILHGELRHQAVGGGVPVRRGALRRLDVLLAPPVSEDALGRVERAEGARGPILLTGSGCSAAERVANVPLVQ